MSQDKIEIIERAIAALNARDIEGYLACCTEDVRLRAPNIAGEYEGRAGILDFFADIEDAGPDFRLDIERSRAVSGGRVLAFMRASATGRASGAPVTLDTANVYDFADDKIRSIEIFTDRNEAIRVVGLEG
jgi:ketosteroid isomerase-like protein